LLKKPTKTSTQTNKKPQTTKQLRKIRNCQTNIQNKKKTTHNHANKTEQKKLPDKQKKSTNNQKQTKKWPPPKKKRKETNKLTKAHTSKQIKK
jgi:hypothetical protein